MFKSLTTRKRNPLAAWQKDMNKLFDRFNKELEIPDLVLGNISPKVEVKEMDNGYTVKAEIPGMNEKDINVSLRGNSLILEGERKTEVEKEDKGQCFSEFSYGSFYRSIPLDEDVNPDKVKASYRDGILTIDLDKFEASAHKAKKIPIMKH